jgi:hypothetical protein
LNITRKLHAARDGRLQARPARRGTVRVCPTNFASCSVALRAAAGHSPQAPASRRWRTISGTRASRRPGHNGAPTDRRCFAKSQARRRSVPRRQSPVQSRRHERLCGPQSVLQASSPFTVRTRIPGQVGFRPVRAAGLDSRVAQALGIEIDAGECETATET